MLCCALTRIFPKPNLPVKQRFCCFTFAKNSETSKENGEIVPRPKPSLTKNSETSKETGKEKTIPYLP